MRISELQEMLEEHKRLYGDLDIMLTSPKRDADGYPIPLPTYEARIKILRPEGTKVVIID